MEQVQDFNLYTRISRAINNSFGTTGPGAGRVSTQKVDLLPLNETMLRAKYHSIVAFSSNNMYEELLRQHRKEAMSMIEASLKNAKENYKKMFPDEKEISLKVVQNSETDNVEFTHFVQGTPVKRGFFHMSCLVEIK